MKINKHRAKLFKEIIDGHMKDDLFSAKFRFCGFKATIVFKSKSEEFLWMNISITENKM